MSSQLPLSPPNSPRVTPAAVAKPDAEPTRRPKRPPAVTLLRATVDRSNRWRAVRTVRTAENGEVVKKRRVEDVEVGDGEVPEKVLGVDAVEGEAVVTRTAESQTAAGCQNNQHSDDNIPPIPPADDVRREDGPESVPPSEGSLRPDWLADVLEAADRVAGEEEDVRLNEGPAESAQQVQTDVSDTEVMTKRAVRPGRRRRLHLFADSDDDEPADEKPPRRLVLATDESDNGEDDDDEPAVRDERRPDDASKPNEEQPIDRSDATQKTTEETQEQLTKLKEFFETDEGPCFEQQMLRLYEPEPERRIVSPSPETGQPPPDRFRTVSVEPPEETHDNESEWESYTDSVPVLVADRPDHIVIRVVEVKVERLSSESPDMAQVPRTPTPVEESSEQSETLPRSSPWPKTPIKEEPQEDTWPHSVALPPRPSSSSSSIPPSPTQPDPSSALPRRRRLRRYASLERSSEGSPDPPSPEIQVPATSDEDFSPPIPAFTKPPSLTTTSSPAIPSSPPPPRPPRKPSPLRIPKPEQPSATPAKPGMARTFRRRAASPPAPAAPRRTRASLAPSTHPTSHTHRLLASLDLTPTRSVPLSVLLSSIPPAILHRELLRLNKFFTLGRPAAEIPATRLDFPPANYDALWEGMQDLAGLWCACVLGRELPVVEISAEEYSVLEAEGVKEEGGIAEWVREVRRRVGEVWVGKGARRRGWEVRVMEEGEVKGEWEEEE